MSVFLNVPVYERSTYELICCLYAPLPDALSMIMMWLT